jgi:hypothetical protein
VGARYQLEEI